MRAAVNWACTSSFGCFMCSAIRSANPPNAMLQASTIAPRAMSESSPPSD
jgi:hypothetical protein